MERLIIDTQQYYTLMVKPHFADLNPVGDVPGTPGSFTVMDDVSSKKKIIDLLGGGNILERKDASCEIQYKPVAGLKPRTIEADKLYGGTKTCDEEFYTGCLEDFQSQSDKFLNFIIDWFGKIMKKDINSNAFFGNIERANDPNGVWSWNKFDGIFKWYGRYIADGTIAASQTTNIASGALTPTDCFNILQWAFDAQTDIMASLPEGMKAFYVSRKIANGYWKFLKQTGGANNIGYYTNGSPMLEFEGIPVIIEPLWNPIMNTLNGGAEANACILTLRGNFTFATDKNYGVQNKDGKYVGMAVWFNVDEQAWKVLSGMKAGTNIAYPELTTIALTPIN
jgi:hypothetical protein